MNLMLHYDLCDDYPGVADAIIGTRLLLIRPRTSFVHIQPILFDFNTKRPCKHPQVPEEHRKVRVA